MTCIISQFNSFVDSWQCIETDTKGKEIVSLLEKVISSNAKVEKKDFRFTRICSDSLSEELKDKIFFLLTQILLGFEGKEKAEVTSQAKRLSKETTKNRFAISNELRGIPINEREDLIRTAWPLIKNQTNGGEIALTLSALYNITEKLRASVAFAAEAPLRGATETRGKFLSELVKIPQKDWEWVIKKGWPIIKEVASGEARGLILFAVYKRGGDDNVLWYASRCLKGVQWRHEQIIYAIDKIPKDEREEIVQKGGPIIKDYSYGRDRAEILLEIAKLPKNERDQVIHNVKPYLVEVTDNPSHLFPAIQSIPKEERWEFYYTIKPLFTGLKCGQERAKLIKAILECPKKRRIPFICQIEILVRKYRFRTDIVKELHLLPQEELSDVLSNIKPLLPTISQFRLHDVIKGIIKIPKKERVEIITLARPLLEKKIITDPEAFFKAVIKIPKEERLATIQLAIPYYKDEDIFDDGKLLSALGKIPKKERRDALEKTFAFVKKNELRNTDIPYYLTTIAKIPHEDLADVLEKVSPILNRQVFDNCACIETLINICKKERADVVKKTLDFVKKYEITYDRLSIFKTIAGIPKEERDEVISQVIDQKNNHNPVVLLRVLGFVSSEARKALLQIEKLLTSLSTLELIAIFIHPNDYKRVEELLEKDSKLQIGSLFQNEPQIKEHTYDYINRRFEEFQNNIAKTNTLSKAVVKHFVALQLWEEHPLFQKAIEISVKTNPAALNKKRNPYTVYNNLKQELTDPLPLKGLNQYKCKDLAVGVHKNSLKDHIQKLKQRIEGLPKEAQEKTTEEIQSTNHSLEQMSCQLLSINYLLELKGDPEDVVGTSTYQLFSLVADMNQADSTVKSPPYLSEQEDKLLLLGKHLQHCMTGKKDAIALLYNQIEKSLDPKIPANDRLEKFVHALVQRHYQEVFESDAFLQEATQSTKISQEAHQTLYLKNRLHRRVGFQHTLQFDTNTGQIYEVLIDTDIALLEKLFYAHVRIEKITEALNKELFKEKGKVITTEVILDYLEGNYFDEDTYQLTEEGTRALLTKLGYR